VHYSNDSLKINVSNLISEKLHHNFHYLGNLFSKIEGTIIAKYWIAQETERIKELLVYDELLLSEIAFKINYCSVSNLSKQFKKVTVSIPSHFKKLKEHK
jgi:YesN/AraC family two-component response regulator